MTQPNDNRPRNRADRIKAIFRARFRELAALFPREGETLVARAVQTATTVSAALDGNVTAESIAEAAIACHHLGLEVGDQAYIYPFKGQAKLTVGPRGLIALAYRSGEIKAIRACSVFRGDRFEYDLGDDSLHHVKAETNRRPRGMRPEQLITHTWARIDTRTEGTILEVLTAEDLAYYRSFSKASVGPWFDNFEGMARKTALKRVLEFVPRSPLLAAAMAESEEGTYEIPEEIMAAIRAKDGARQEDPQHEPVRGDVPSQAEAS